MNAMLYLIRKEIKNKIIYLIKHPGKLILYIGVLALLIFTIFTSEQPKGNDFLDIRILQGFYFVALTGISLPIILTGLKSGATFFSMSDVNFLFVSPISPKKILAYGLLTGMGSTLSIMVFLMFYSGMVCDAFAITPLNMFVLLIGIAVVVFTMQIVALIVYNFTSGNSFRVKAVKNTIFTVIAIILAYILYGFLTNGADMDALCASISSPYLQYIPLVGWVKGLAFAIINNDTNNIIIFAVLTLIAILGSILVFTKTNSDYYGDVLQATESSYALKKSVKEGRNNTGIKLSKSVKVRDTGINHGWGANTFFYKHLREEKRKRLIPYFRVSTLILAAANIIFAFVMQKVSAADGETINPEMILFIALAADSYILFFSNLVSDWARELTVPYIYLVPEKPFQKLIWSSASSILKPLIDGVVVFTALSLFIRVNPLSTLIAILIFGSVGFIYTATNILFQRVFGSMSSNGIIGLMYFMFIAVLLAPGIILSFLIYCVNDQIAPVILGLPIFACDVLISLLIFVCCRNLLSNLEMNEKS